MSSSVASGSPVLVELELGTSPERFNGHGSVRHQLEDDDGDALESDLVGSTGIDLNPVVKSPPLHAGDRTNEGHAVGVSSHDPIGHVVLLLSLQLR